MTATYQALVDDMKALGVEQVFGLMSDDTAVFATALDGPGIRFYGARHENNAIAMAEGYAFATGGLGVAMVGRGPATANGLHAAPMPAAPARAADHLWRAGGADGRGQHDRPGLQGLQLHRRAGRRRPAHLRRNSPDTARGALADAAEAALQGGAAALLLPTNVQHAEIDLAKAPPPPALAQPRPPAPPRAQAIAAAAAVLRPSRKPIIVAGLGAHLAGAKDEIERWPTGPARCSPPRPGKDMFRGHPSNLGILGSFSHSMARRMVDQADCGWSSAPGSIS